MNQIPVSAPSENLLVDVHGIGRAVFGETSPSERTLRSLTKRGVLPHFRIGKLVRYDPRLVRAALDLHCLVHAKTSSAKAVRTAHS